jgi:hypothetical protein
MSIYLEEFTVALRVFWGVFLRGVESLCRGVFCRRALRRHVSIAAWCSSGSCWLGARDGVVDGGIHAGAASVAAEFVVESLALYELCVFLGVEFCALFFKLILLLLNLLLLFLQSCLIS